MADLTDDDLRVAAITIVSSDLGLSYRYQMLAQAALDARREIQGIAASVGSTPETLYHDLAGLQMEAALAQTTLNPWASTELDVPCFQCCVVHVMTLGEAMADGAIIRAVARGIWCCEACCHDDDA